MAVNCPQQPIQLPHTHLFIKVDCWPLHLWLVLPHAKQGHKAGRPYRAAAAAGYMQQTAGRCSE